MDMEWGVDERDDKIWILQARPETVWSRKEKSETTEKANTLDTGNREIIVFKRFTSFPWQCSR